MDHVSPYRINLGFLTQKVWSYGAGDAAVLWPRLEISLEDCFDEFVLGVFLRCGERAATGAVEESEAL